MAAAMASVMPTSATALFRPAEAAAAVLFDAAPLNLLLPEVVAVPVVLKVVLKVLYGPALLQEAAVVA